MPQTICTNCRSNLDRCYKFRLQCKKADEALREYPVSGFLPKPFPPISNDFPETNLKRKIETRSNNDAMKKVCLDNGDQRDLRVGKVAVSKQQKERSREVYMEIDPASDHDANNDNDDGLEPGEIRVHSCDQCDRKFPLLQSLKNHVKNSHCSSKFKCTKCGLLFFSKQDIQKHMLNHSDDYGQIRKRQPYANLRHLLYKCTECEEENFTKEELEKHKETMHNVKIRHQCNLCEKSFVSKNVLERHELVHSEDELFICGYCKETFSTTTKLARHLPTHPGHKPFSCKLCPRKFLLSHHLTRHIRTHQGEKIHQSSQEINQSPVNRAGLGLVCEICDETCRNRADFVTHMAEHMEVGDKKDSGDLNLDSKEKMRLECGEDEDEDEEQEEGHYSHGDDEFRPPSYVAKKISKPKRNDNEEIKQEEYEQVVFMRGKDGSLVRKTIKTLMPIQRKENVQKTPEKTTTNTQIDSKQGIKLIEAQRERSDENGSQNQEIIIPATNEENNLSNTAHDLDKQSKETTSIPAEKSKKIIVKKSVVTHSSSASAASNAPAKSSQASPQIQPSSNTAAKVTKRIIVRRIIRKGDTTREVIMNPDGTIVDSSELAKLRSGNVMKRVVVRNANSGSTPNIASILKATSNANISEDVQKLINQQLPSSATPKIVTVQKLEQKQAIAIRSNSEPKTKDQMVIEKLQKSLKQKDLKIKELQAQTQQQFDVDEMIPERNDESDEEQQLPLKRVFVKRNQSVYDEEKKYDDNVEEPTQPNVIVLSNDLKDFKQIDSSSKDNKEIDQSLESNQPKLIVVNPMSSDDGNNLESTESYDKKEKTETENLPKTSSNNATTENSCNDKELNQSEEPIKQNISFDENLLNTNHTFKINVTQNEDDGVKLEFLQSEEIQTSEEQVETGLSNLNTQVLFEPTGIFENSQNVNTEEKSEVNIGESIMEISSTNEPSNLNESHDSRDSLEIQLSQMEG